MREIKFRAIKDDMSNCSFQQGQLTYDSNGCPRIHFADGTSTSCLKGTEGQFTGLKDKNGKEIYEGDIIGRQGFWNRVVMWKDYTFVTYSTNNPERIMPMNKNSFDEFDEVIGNLYENPELL
jgi:uncharacterized phage protein (TIGR01671 family)